MLNRETYPRHQYGDWELIDDVDADGKLLLGKVAATAESRTLGRVYGKDGTTHQFIGSRKDAEAFVAKTLEATKKKEA